MSQSPLSKEAFASAIARGAGSAFLHVRNHGDNDIEQELLHACLVNLVYDTQLNSGRAAWLASMIDWTGNSGRYATAIQAALESVSIDTPARDAEQLVSLAGELFERGFVEFKMPLIRLSQLAASDDFALTLCRNLVDVGGIVGFEYAVRFVMRVGAARWKKQELYKYATEVFQGERELLRVLEREPAELTLYHYLKEAKDEDEEDSLDEPPQVQPKQATSLKDVIELIDTDPKGTGHRSVYRSFGKTAGPDDVQMLSRRFDEETAPSRLFGYLSVFSNMTLNIVPEKVFDLLEAEDDDLRRSARNVLSKVQSPRVRQRALRALESLDDEQIYLGIALLELNYVNEDLVLLDRVLRQMKDRDFIHWSAMVTLRIAKRCNSDEFSPTLLWIYQSTPCSSCRGDALELLLDWKSAPEHVIFEAQWDAEPEVRQIARACSCIEPTSFVR